MDDADRDSANGGTRLVRADRRFDVDAASIHRFGAASALSTGVKGKIETIAGPVFSNDCAAEFARQRFTLKYHTRFERHHRSSQSTKKPVPSITSITRSTRSS